jgi:hypothetical protein
MAFPAFHGGVQRSRPSCFEAVTEEMDFAQALQPSSVRYLKAQLMDAFLESLDKTLLHTDVPDTAEPSPLRFYLEPSWMNWTSRSCVRSRGQSVRRPEAANR